MKKTDLTTAEAGALKERIDRMVWYLVRCRQRLDALKFDPECKLYREVTAARDAVNSLRMELHYQSIPGGVGRPPKA